MENKEIIKEYSITKKTAIMIMMQMVLITIALGLSMIGIFKSINLANSTSRIIVYSCQALTCFAILLFGTYYFNKKDTSYFRSVVIAYALLEAIRVSLLQTGGINDFPSFFAKFILVLLALDAALLSDRTDKKEGLYLGLTMVGLEILLYIVFIIGFPAVRTRMLYMVMPFVGILMAGSMCIFITGRLEQKLYSNVKDKKKNK